MALAEGTRVWLINGSPEMTVKYQTSSGISTYLCNWFVGDVINEHEFSESQLTAIPPAKSGRKGKFKSL